MKSFHTFYVDVLVCILVSSTDMHLLAIPPDLILM
jgi:hypothetical protein